MPISWKNTPWEKTRIYHREHEEVKKVKKLFLANNSTQPKKRLKKKKFFLPFLILTTFAAVALDEEVVDETDIPLSGSGEADKDSTEFGLLNTLHCVMESSGVSKKFKSNSEWASNFTSVISSTWSWHSVIVELMFDESIWKTSMMALNFIYLFIVEFLHTRIKLFFPFLASKKEVHRWDFIFN